MYFSIRLQLYQRKYQNVSVRRFVQPTKSTNLTVKRKHGRQKAAHNICCENDSHAHKKNPEGEKQKYTSKLIDNECQKHNVYEQHNSNMLINRNMLIRFDDAHKKH